MNDLLIALRPKWLDLILDGRKTAELRRQMPARLAKGQRVVFYSNGSLCGEAEIADWVRGLTAADLAARYHDRAAMSEADALAYLDGGRCCGALLLSKVRRYDAPRRWQHAAPQNFLYLH